MKKHVSLILAGVLLVLALAACSGGNIRIADGLYLPQNPNMAEFVSLEFKDGKITRTTYHSHIDENFSETSDYTLKKEKHYGLMLTYGSMETRLSVTSVDNDTIVFPGVIGTYIRQK